MISFSRSSSWVHRTAAGWLRPSVAKFRPPKNGNIFWTAKCGANRPPRMLPHGGDIARLNEHLRQHRRQRRFSSGLSRPSPCRRRRCARCAARLKELSDPAAVREGGAGQSRSPTAMTVRQGRATTPRVLSLQRSRALQLISRRVLRKRAACGERYCFSGPGRWLGRRPPSRDPKPRLHNASPENQTCPGRLDETADPLWRPASVAARPGVGLTATPRLPLAVTRKFGGGRTSACSSFIAVPCW